MPKTTVAAIVKRDDGRGTDVLLVRRRKDPFAGHWCLPGGHIEPNEPAQQAVVREVKEETGLDFTGRFFGYFDEIFPDYGFHAVVLAFAGVGSGTLHAQEAEVLDIAWFPIEEARALSLAFGHNLILDTCRSTWDREATR